jgi:integrase
MARKVPKLRRHKTTVRAVVTIGGRDVYLGDWPNAKKTAPESVQLAYQRAVAEWLATGARPAPAVPEPVGKAHSPTTATVAVLLARFWEHAEAHYRQPDGAPGNELHCFRSALRPVRALYADLPANDFSPLKLKAVRVELVRRGLAREFVNGLVRRVRHVFRWGVENELVAPSVLHGLQAVSGLKRGQTDAPEGRTVRPVNPDLVEKTLPFLPKPVADLVRLLALTGARCGEVCQLRPADVDRGGAVWLFTPPRHKTAHKGKSRVIAIGPKAQALLGPLLDGLRPDEFVFSPARWAAEQRAVRSAARKTPRWPAHMARNAKKRKATPKRAPGARYTTAAVGQAIGRACEKEFPPPAWAKRETGETAAMWAARLGVGRLQQFDAWKEENWWTAHQLRHTAATAIRKAFGLDHAQSVLGHAGANMTQHYAEVGIEKAAEVALKLG